MSETFRASVLLIYLFTYVSAGDNHYAANPHLSNIRSTLRRYVAMIQYDIKLIEGLIAKGSAPDGNLALGKPTRQSSTFSAFPSYKAVDGVWKPNRLDSCAITKKDHNPWWSVDLLSVYPVKSVVVLNRGDCCGKRFRMAHVYVGNSLSSMKVCGYFKGPGRDGQRITIRCRYGTRSRYVKIQLAGKEYLQLSEVGVYSK